jgi:MEMO1 family protein
MSGTTKEPNVAGSFYPLDPQELTALIDRYLGEVSTPQTDITPKAIIAPHAGFIYSGPIAASAYKSVAVRASSIKRIVVLAPTHHYQLQGACIPSFDGYQTPLGRVQIDRASVEQLSSLAVISQSDICFEREHALEVHLPFIQRVFDPTVPVTPIIVGASSAQQLLTIFEKLDDSKTLFIVSGDLSHFLPYEEAKELDLKTSGQLEQLQFDQLTHDQSCGYYPLQGLLLWAQQSNLKLRTVDLRNSGDTAGDRDRVVGYGAFTVS